MSDKQKAPYFM